jgi:hypothetical protein
MQETNRTRHFSLVCFDIRIESASARSKEQCFSITLLFFFVFFFHLFASGGNGVHYPCDGVRPEQTPSAA